MKVLKKGLVLALTAAVAVTMAACGSKGSGGTAKLTEYTLSAADTVTATGSLVPAWAEKGADSSFILGVQVKGTDVTGNLTDAAEVGDDGTVEISNVKVTSELGDDLNDKTATNTGFLNVTGTDKDTTVNVTNAELVFSDNSDGANANDFTGCGTLITATGSESTKTLLTLDNINIKTAGFGRDGVVVDAYANAVMTNSSVYTAGNNPLTNAYEGYASTAAQAYMISPPWILGIYGGVRSSNVLGTNSSFTVVDSSIESGSWAVISTDDCTNPTVNVVNSTLKISGYDGTDETGNNSTTSMNGGAALFGYETNYGSGYGTYNIGSAYENFYGTTFDGVTYATILTGAARTYYGASSEGLVLKNEATGETVYTYDGEAKDTVVNAVFGTMDHQGADDVVLDEGSVWNTEEAVMLVRGSQTSSYTVSGAEMNPASGILFQMMDDDDGYGTSGAGGDTTGDQGFAKWDGTAWGMPTFSSGFRDDNEAGFVAPSTGGSYNTTLVLTTNEAGDDVEYNGDILNGTGTGKDQSAGGLLVTIEDGVTLNGAISSSSAVHGLPYSADAVSYLNTLAEKYGDGVSPNGGDTYTVKYTLLDADGNVTTDESKAAYIQLNEFTMNEYYIISHVVNKIMAGANILVDVEEGATWNVDEDCYITGLVNNGTIKIAEGATLYVNGTAYDGTAAEAGDLTAGNGTATVDSKDWTVGEIYRNECMGKYSDITIDGHAYYVIGSTADNPVTGSVITDVAFTLQGWLVVGDDGTLSISKEYVETAQQSGGMGGDPGSGTGGDPGAGTGGDPGAGMGGDPGAGMGGDPGAGGGQTPPSN